MAHPLHHAIGSKRRFGDGPDDEQAIHGWFDASKEHMATSPTGRCAITPKAFSKATICSVNP